MWIRDNFPTESTILDVGACDGKWRNLLAEYQSIDACEIFHDNAERIKPNYRQVFEADIFDLRYGWYDLIIFGDVIEHMTVSRAKAVLAYAKKHCKNMVIGVPFLYRQDEMYGNPYERHIQDDLTHELFNERYKGFKILCDTGMNYAYYIKE